MGVDSLLLEWVCLIEGVDNAFIGEEGRAVRRSLLQTEGNDIRVLFYPEIVASGEIRIIENPGFT